LAAAPKPGEHHITQATPVALEPQCLAMPLPPGPEQLTLRENWRQIRSGFAQLSRQTPRGSISTMTENSVPRLQLHQKTVGLEVKW
jgi:hypothetical protein